MWRYNHKMPTYKFVPNLEKNPEHMFTFVDLYDPQKKVNETVRILYGQTFTTDKYYSASYMKHEEFEFVSDEPFVSPILCCFNGEHENALEVPDCGHLFDIYVVAITQPVTLYFNNNKDGERILVTKESSGIIFKSMAPAGIRIVNTYCTSKYSIALLLTNHFAANNG